MEKIALKNNNTQGGGVTYEFETTEARQLIASISEYREIATNTSFELNLTSQKWSGYEIPISMGIFEIVLFFSQANNQNMKIFLGGGAIDENFLAPNGAGAVTISIAETQIDVGQTQRMVVTNLETTPINPLPVLRSWSIVYRFIE